MTGVRAILLTGVSGSGKSTAAKALEDHGFFCIDNLPVQLLETFLRLCDSNAEVDRVAVVMDVRERRFVEESAKALAHIRSLGLRVEVLFLDATDEILIRRFNETRRKHPLADAAGSITAAIRAERGLLADLREMATAIIDTSPLNVHELKRRVQEFAGALPDGGGRIRVALQSFGFKYGVPPEAHYVFDVRFIPNPYFEAALRPLSGQDPAVAEFVRRRPETESFLAHLEPLVKLVVPLNEAEGKTLLSIAVGCTGGRHRSVFVAEHLAQVLSAAGYVTDVFHRDIAREGSVGAAARTAPSAP